MFYSMDSSNITVSESETQRKLASYRTQNIALWVIFAILLIILIILIILLAIAASKVSQVEKAFEGAALNPNVCIDNRCTYIQVNPPVPNFISDTYDPSVALFTAQLVLNVEYYQENGNNLNLPTQLSFIGFINTVEQGAPVFGFGTVDPINRVLYIVFRGTRTAQEWSYDANFGQELFRTQVVASRPDKKYIQCSQDTMIHSGFYTIFEQIVSQVDDIIRQTNEMVDTIVVTGHSLGGAIASLVSIHLASIVIGKRIIVYTFGKPRVGNNAYAECIRENIGNRFNRLENESDLIPDLPLSATPNLKDYDSPWIYTHEGVRVGYDLNWGSLQTNHLMPNYVFGIQNLI